MSEELTHEQKIEWMAVWCAKNNLKLELEGECGFGRECVGVTAHSNFPDYEWWDDDFNRIDTNGDVWCPKDAYHKHPCVAVLGRGEAAEAQLYDWLKWFDANSFKLELVPRKVTSVIEVLMGKSLHVRMTRGS